MVTQCARTKPGADRVRETHNRAQIRDPPDLLEFRDQQGRMPTA
jgi:hypothetical protein